jgi:hypothetical protein
MTQLEILLLEFSRDRKSYHDTLMHCEELEESRQALRRSGFNPEHPSGAKQILSPSDYEAALDVACRGNWRLKPRHVLVSDNLEDVVIRAVRGTRSSFIRRCRQLQVSLKSGSMARLDFATPESQNPRTLYFASYERFYPVFLHHHHPNQQAKTKTENKHV